VARAGAQAATKEAARLIMHAKAQDKITIYGPKTDGTYLVEFRAADWAIARDLHSGKRSGRAAPFPGPDALWAGCAGCSVRNHWRGHVFPRWSPPTVAPNPSRGFPRPRP
jgi:hypothetical protein